MNRAAFLGGTAVLTLVPSASLARSPRKKLRAAMARIAKDFPGAIGVCARTLARKEPLVAYRAYESFPTASTIKVLIMATAFVMEEQQPGTLETQVQFDRSELIAGSDFMQSAVDGQSFTVGELLVPMIAVSDNTAANMLIGYFGVGAINDVGRMAGLLQTQLHRKFLDWYAVIKHEDNVSTPGDMTQLLYAIETGAHEGTRTFCSAAHCRTMIGIMLRQTDRDGIPAAVPGGVAVANKTGEIEGTRDDVAVVDPYGESPLVLAIMTKAAYDYPASYAAIHAVTRAVIRSVRS